MTGVEQTAGRAQEVAAEPPVESGKGAVEWWVVQSETHFPFGGLAYWGPYSTLEEARSSGFYSDQDLTTGLVRLRAAA